MFVRNQPWDGINWRWTGKVHWMERPFVTTCGIDVGPTWREYSARLDIVRPLVCKHCVSDVVD